MPEDSAVLPAATASASARRAAGPHILSIATAVPDVVMHQREVIARATSIFDSRCSDVTRLMPVFENAGIRTRYSCMPLDWYHHDHGWAERNALYVSHAVELLERATRACLARSGTHLEDIDAIVTVSTTGIATPSLDALLTERLGLRRDITRLPIFGLGCAGGVLGLARAAALAQVMPGARVLFLVVELCSLTFRRGDQSKSNVVATALFGDGAAAVLLGPAPAGSGGRGARFGVEASGEHTWPASLDVMGWHIEDDGLGVLFSRDIPTLVRTQFRAALDAFLSKHDLDLADIDRFVCHPGGAKVISALEEAFSIAPGTLDSARTVLRDYGNMSAATVLFVLEQTLAAAPPTGRMLLSALGPGFTAAFLTLHAA